MATKNELIQFQIENRTLCGYDLPLFQQNVYSINATTQYLWDITTQNLSCGTASIVINGITYTLSFAPNLQGLLDALNALGFGFFCYAVSEGSTFLYTTDDVNIYGNLDICLNATTTSTTTTSTTQVPTSTSSTTTSTTLTTSTTTSTTTLAWNFYFQNRSSVGSNPVRFGVRVNGGAWQYQDGLIFTTVPLYSVLGSRPVINIGDNVDVSIQKVIIFGSQYQNIQFGLGATSFPNLGDWTSRCAYDSFVFNGTDRYYNIDALSGDYVACGQTTTSTTSTSTTIPPTSTTTSTTTTTTTLPPPTSTTTTSTTTSTTTNPVSIQLGNALCRLNNCNDNAQCSVRYRILTTNAPAGSYITVSTDPPPSGASVAVFNNDPNNGVLQYSEPNGLQGAVFFTLELRNSGGTIIATSSTSLAHQSFWAFLPLCT